MTSVAHEAKTGSVDVKVVAREVVRAFGNVFGLTPRLVASSDPLMAMPAAEPVGESIH